MPKGQVDWRDLPDANGKTYWELHPDEPIPNEDNKTWNQVQKEKTKPEKV